MIVRREFVLGAAAAGVLMQPRFGFAKASQPATNVNFDVPEGACDCHTHIHGDPAKFPWFAERTYTPEMALPEEMTALHKALKIQRVVIVTPSVYGPDNSATIYGMAARGKDARGVAVIDDNTTDAELDRLASLGFKGIRLNLSTAGINDPKVATERFLSAAARVKSRNWHIQLNTTLPVIAAMKDALAASPVTLVFDHYGNAKEELGVGQHGFSDLVSLVKSGKAYVKVSVTAGPRENYGYFTPLAQMLISANVDRILWGTNWPHPNSVGRQRLEGNAAVAGRRRACAQSPAGLGAGRCGAQENPRRQSGAAVRILIYYVEPIIESMRLAGASAVSLTFGLAGRQLFCQATSASRRCRRNVASWHKADMPRCLQRTAGETRKVPLHLKQFRPQRLPVENQPVEQRPSGAPVSIGFLQRLHAAVKGQPTLPIP